VSHRLQWDVAGLHDLAEIIRAIASERPATASKVGKRIQSLINLLVQYPGIGRVIRKEGDRVFRSTSAESYRIFYATQGDVVEILRVIHCRRDFDSNVLRDGLSDDRDNWRYVPERDDPWMDEAIAQIARGEWVTHEEAMRYIHEVIAEELARHAKN